MIQNDGTKWKTECLAVSTEEEAKAALLLLAANQKDFGFCPRCGSEIYNPHTRAISRRLDIMICESCGTAEAMEDLLFHTKNRERLPLLEWAALRKGQQGGGK